MYWITRLAVLMLVLTMLSSCIRTMGCPDGAIDWVDVLMINDVKYQHQPEESPNQTLDPQIIKGKPIGKIKFKMADKACRDHKMLNGDATYLEEGTTVYAVKGYPKSLMVITKDRIYIAEQKKGAKRVGELYPIKGLVKNIYIVNIEDNSRVHTFSTESKERFLEEWLKLKLVNYNEMAKKGAFNEKEIFLEIELNNGVSLKLDYYANSNAFGVGANGTQSIQEILKQELAAVQGK